nr:LLM class flavin-dependent oxidoreductase [Streptomyces spongiae]
MNELLDALEAIWTTDPAAYQGELVSVPLHHSPLKPARRPRPPFYLGALSERALRRVAERGDGWLPLCVVPSYLDIDGLVAQRAVIDRLAREAGRDPSATRCTPSTASTEPSPSPPR